MKELKNLKKKTLNGGLRNCKASKDTTHHKEVHKINWEQGYQIQVKKDKKAQKHPWRHTSQIRQLALARSSCSLESSEVGEIKKLDPAGQFAGSGLS